MRCGALEWGGGFGWHRSKVICLYQCVLEEEQHAVSSGSSFPLEVLIPQPAELGDTEQKSGCVLQTVLLEGESKGQRVSPSTGGDRKQCQVSKYIETVNFRVFGRESGYATAKPDPATQLKKSSCVSEQLYAVFRCTWVGPNSHDFKGRVLRMKAKLFH